MNICCLFEAMGSMPVAMMKRNGIDQIKRRASNVHIVQPSQIESCNLFSRMYKILRKWFLISIRASCISKKVDVTSPIDRELRVSRK